MDITVKKIAERIIAESNSFYSREMLNVIPPFLLEKRLSDNNLHAASEALDRIRFKRERLFAELLGKPLRVRYTVEEVSEKIREAVNAVQDDSLLEGKRREIKFLFNLAATVAHQ